MRHFATLYLIAVALAVGFLFLLQLPGVLILLTVFTMGLGYLAVLPLLNIAIWLVAFVPAVLGACINWRIGAGMAAVVLALAVSFPKWLPDPAHDGVALLQPPFAASGPIEVNSVDITSPGSIRDVEGIARSAVNALKRNTDLKWIRVGRTVYERRDGILHQVRAGQGNFHRDADVIVAIPSGRHAAVWGNAPLSPWRVEEASGYLIHDTRTDRPLARNLSLKVLRAIKPFMLEFTGVQLEAGHDPKIEFVRAPYGEVSQDPAQTLESDLKVLGLWRDEADTELEPENPTNSPVKSVDAMLEKMLEDVELAQHKGAGSRSPDLFEAQVIEDFNGQLAARVAIEERIDLIARMERSKISRLDRDEILSIAQETPALMQRMVDLYYEDLAEDASVYRVLERIARNKAYVPLARAVGRDRTRFIMALGGGDRHQREFLIQNFFLFAPEDPYLILRTLFFPRPPGDPLQERYVEGYRAVWKDEWRRDDILRNVRSGSEMNKSDMQEEADLAMRLLLTQEDVPHDVLTGFVEDWVLTRRSAILHDYSVLLEVLSRLQEIGAQELHANLLTYFADLIEFRPHWMDPPT